MLKLMGKGIFTILRSKILFKPMMYIRCSHSGDSFVHMQHDVLFEKQEN